MQPQNWSPVSGPEVHGANLLLLFAISKAILTLCVLAKRKVLGPVVLASHRRPFGLCENATYINAPHSGHNTQIHSNYPTFTNCTNSANIPHGSGKVKYRRRWQKKSFMFRMSTFHFNPLRSKPLFSSCITTSVRDSY